MTSELNDRQKRMRALNAVLDPIPLYPIPCEEGCAADRAHIAGFYYPLEDLPRNYAIYYAVELTPHQYMTDESVIPAQSPPLSENKNIGLKNGVFRWITGTPGFDGDNNGAKMENETPNPFKWYEGILIKDGMYNPNRKIDIKELGDYATLNGFNFSVRNDLAFWKIIEDEKIYIANYQVRVFVVLDKTFYNLWEGVVKSISHTETEYEFKCETDFKVIHKAFPQRLVTEELFGDSVNKDSIGQAVPVCLGDAPYAEGLNVSNVVKPVMFKIKKANVVSG
ncbi:MAG: hypothetical protein LBI42_12485 [Chitinispirillales bacterium]|jgi:hypothetical protein|nr:hypothetical protein [Chitinispirillales bacterium]